MNNNNNNNWNKLANEAWIDEMENADGFANENPSANFINGFEQGVDTALNMLKNKVTKYFKDIPKLNEAISLERKMELASLKIQALEIIQLIDEVKKKPNETDL